MAGCWRLVVLVGGKAGQKLCLPTGRQPAGGAARGLAAAIEMENESEHSFGGAGKSTLSAIATEWRPAQVKAKSVTQLAMNASRVRDPCIACRTGARMRWDLR